MRLVFCGTPQFAVPTLKALLQAGHRVELVLSQPDRASGRGMEVQISPLKRYAEQHGLALTQPEKIRNNTELQERLRALSPDAIIIVAYGRLIPPWMLALPKYGNLNVHASLLPKYRGAAPIQWAVANGETETGVTTMRIDEGLDTGDVLLQERVPISPQQTSVELSPVLAEVGAELMVRTLAGLEQGTLQAAKQDSTKATLAPILQREDGRDRLESDRTTDLRPLARVSTLAGSVHKFPRKEIASSHDAGGCRCAGIGSGSWNAGAASGNRLLVACGEGLASSCWNCRRKGNAACRWRRF